MTAEECLKVRDKYLQLAIKAKDENEHLRFRYLTIASLWVSAYVSIRDSRPRLLSMDGLRRTETNPGDGSLPSPVC
jgi:hypothetical protein